MNALYLDCDRLPEALPACWQPLPAALAADERVGLLCTGKPPAFFAGVPPERLVSQCAPGSLLLTFAGAAAPSLRGAGRLAFLAWGSRPEDWESTLQQAREAGAEAVVGDRLPDELPEGLPADLLAFYAECFLWLPPLRRADTEAPSGRLRGKVLVVYDSTEEPTPSALEEQCRRTGTVPMEFAFADLLPVLAEEERFALRDLAAGGEESELLDGLDGWGAVLCALHDPARLHAFRARAASCGLPCHLWSDVEASPLRWILSGLGEICTEAPALSTGASVRERLGGLVATVRQAREENAPAPASLSPATDALVEELFALAGGEIPARVQRERALYAATVPVPHIGVQTVAPPFGQLRRRRWLARPAGLRALLAFLTDESAPAAVPAPVRRALRREVVFALAALRMGSSWQACFTTLLDSFDDAVEVVREVCRELVLEESAARRLLLFFAERVLQSLSLEPSWSPAKRRELADAALGLIEEQRALGPLPLEAGGFGAALLDQSDRPQEALAYVREGYEANKAARGWRGRIALHRLHARMGAVLAGTADLPELAALAALVEEDIAEERSLPLYHERILLFEKILRGALPEAEALLRGERPEVTLRPTAWQEGAFQALLAGETAFARTCAQEVSSQPDLPVQDQVRTALAGFLAGEETVAAQALEAAFGEPAQVPVFGYLDNFFVAWQLAAILRLGGREEATGRWLDRAVSTGQPVVDRAVLATRFENAVPVGSVSFLSPWLDAFEEVAPTTNPCRHPAGVTS